MDRRVILNILFGGNGERGAVCLNALLGKGYKIVCVLVHPLTKEEEDPGSVTKVAEKMGLPVLHPVNVNDPNIIADLLQFAPDLIVLAGYRQIVKQAFIDLSEFGCINLHGGVLPQYRGSSPMNWALIKGDREFGISITQVDTGVDTGNVLDERIFPISNEDTIVDLHRTANRAFPEMLLGVLAQIENGTSQGRIQDEAQASYWPLRFPADGLILWVMYTADQIHNRIRALTEPYPCAFTFFKGQRVKLLASRLNDVPHYGDPGRIYAKRRGGILVCASDRCLWIQRALIGEAQEDLSHFVERYDKFATMCDLVVEMLPT